MQLVCLPAQSLPGGDDDVTEVFLDLPHAQPCPSEAVLIAGGNTQSTREKVELFLSELREGFQKMNCWLISDVTISGLYSKDRIIERMHELCETNERECHFKSLYCKQKSLKQRNSFATTGHAGLVSFNFKQKVR